MGPPCSRLSGFLDGHHGTMLLTMLKVCNQSQQLHYAAKGMTNPLNNNEIKHLNVHFNLLFLLPLAFDLWAICSDI